jgi:chromosome segregation ATPase
VPEGVDSVSSFPDGPGDLTRESIGERVDGIAAWISDLDARVRAAELATGDEKTAKELRRAIEALAKHDPKLEKRLIDRVDVLADRLATLASTVSTTAAALARKDGEIAGLRKSVEDGGKRVDALVRELGKGGGAEEIEKLRAAVRAVQAERPARASDSRVESLGAKLTYLNERIDTLATTVATTAAGLAGRDGELVTLRQQLDESSSRVEQTAVELRRMTGDGALVRRLDALQSAIDETTASVADRESDVTAIRARVDEAYSRIGTVVAGIQSSLATLTAQVGALEALPETTEQALEARTGELDARVDELAGQVGSLAASLELATSAFVDGRAETARLGERADDASTRIDAVVDQLTEALGRLPEPGVIDAELEARLAGLTGSVDEATEHIAALSSAAAAQSESAAALEGSLAHVRDRLSALELERSDAAAQLEAIGAAWSREHESVRSQLGALESAHAEAERTSEGLRPRLEALAARVDSVDLDRAEVSAELQRISVALEAEREGLSTRLDDFASALVEATAASERGPESDLVLRELAARLDGLEQHGAGVAAEIGRLAAAYDAERAALRAQLDAFSAGLAEATQTSDDAAVARAEALVAALAARVTTLEEHGAAVASEMERASAARASELEAIEAQLAQVPTAAAQSSPDLNQAGRELVAGLGRRIAAMEQDRHAVAAEIARATSSWHEEQVALARRVEEVASKLATAASEPAASTDASEGDVAQLRVALEGIRMRLASSEQELATLVGTRDTTTRFDELTRRLESLERAPVVVANTADGSPLPGDGRFRLELRALELRMEHAEAAARENREAVLVQLERLAARIEWRFRRLEEEYEARQPQAVGGQVVPLRPDV